MFIVLHMGGSHFAYSLRYPQEFEVFSPTLPGYSSFEGQNARNSREFRNAYDNSILYSDFVLAEVIERLMKTDRSAALLYTSDHGQNLYDDEREKFMHGTVDPSRVEAHVPLFVWFSDEYARRHPERPLMASRNRDRPVSVESLFTWLLDLGSVGYKGEDASRSVFSPEFRERRQLVWTVDRKIVAYETLE